MHNKTGFCHECNNEVAIRIENATLEGNLKGNNYIYEGEVGKSADCEHLVSDEEIDKHNLKALHDIYRVEKDIITLEKIHELPEKYDIGKRPLSNLLDWGELTFTRYFDGDIPSKAYSKILEQIYNSPKKYLEILEKNKDFISIKAYEKSKLATNNLLVNTSKINSVLGYILYVTKGDITPLSTQKLLYYCEGFYYAFFNKVLFEDDCYAHEQGCIYLEIHKNYNYTNNNSCTEFDLSIMEKAIIDSVIKNMGCFSSGLLTNFTTKENPWLFAKGSLDCNTNISPIIEKSLIHTYFSSIVNKYGMVSIADIRTYAEKMFLTLT